MWCVWVACMLSLALWLHLRSVAHCTRTNTCSSTAFVFDSHFQSLSFFVFTETLRLIFAMRIAISFIYYCARLLRFPISMSLHMRSERLQRARYVSKFVSKKWTCGRLMWFDVLCVIAWCLLKRGNFTQIYSYEAVKYESACGRKHITILSTHLSHFLSYEFGVQQARRRFFRLNNRLILSVSCAPLLNQWRRKF